MAGIKTLNIGSVRNISESSVVLESGLNLFHGNNGSGKTSVLESVHALATGRSFRSRRLDLLVQHGSRESVVFAELVSGHKVGFSKPLRSNPVLKLNAEKEKNWESVSLLLPTLILDSNTFLLIDGGPKERRSFLDWGVFHVEPTFLSSWRDVRKCIAHRNQLLKSNQSSLSHIAAWDEELSGCSEKTDKYRRDYLSSFSPVFKEVYSDLTGSSENELSITYSRGWDDSKSLREVLLDNLDLDRRYGSTQYGPHRAELVVRDGKHKAIDTLSRGQLKLLVVSLKLAQAKLLENTYRENTCTFLIDDLASELDSRNRAAVLSYLSRSRSQSLITSVSDTDIVKCLPNAVTIGTFHVERGTIRA
ncbi:MAG: DNA replication/repair protein RecF [Pseudohongiellaceae bacterium]